MTIDILFFQKEYFFSKKLIILDGKHHKKPNYFDRYLNNKRKEYKMSVDNNIKSSEQSIQSSLN